MFDRSFVCSFVVRSFVRSLFVRSLFVRSFVVRSFVGCRSLSRKSVDVVCGVRSSMFGVRCAVVGERWLQSVVVVVVVFVAAAFVVVVVLITALGAVCSLCCKVAVPSVSLLFARSGDRVTRRCLLCVAMLSRKTCWHGDRLGGRL